MKGNLYLIAIIGLLFFFFPTANALQTWDGTASEAWTNGSGTEADPYLIETPAHLKYLSAQVAAGNTYEGVYFFLNLHRKNFGVLAFSVSRMDFLRIILQKLFDKL